MTDMALPAPALLSVSVGAVVARLVAILVVLAIVVAIRLGMTRRN